MSDKDQLPPQVTSLSSEAATSKSSYVCKGATTLLLFFFYKLHEQPIHLHPSSAKITDLQVLLLLPVENLHPSNNPLTLQNHHFPLLSIQTSSLFAHWPCSQKKEHFFTQELALIFSSLS